MVIIGSINGQLANQLFYFSHFIANSVEYGYELHNPIFNDYTGYFKPSFNMFEGNPICVKYGINIPAGLFSKFNKIAKKIVRQSRIHVYYSLDEQDSIFDLNNLDFLKDAKTKMVIVDGWLFRDYKNFKKHAALIRRLFTPKDIHWLRIEELIQSVRKESNILVGVHLRKGDYSRFKNAKYFFDDEIYLKKMLDLRNIIKDKMGKEVFFLLCSDESIDKNNFRQVDFIEGIGGRVEDLYSLSKCDFIMGPPSTFSMWASFYGEVPLFQIESRDSQLKLEHFSVVTG